MNWLNIHTPSLRSPAFIGSDPIARATWLYVIAYCCEQENSGTIIGAGQWKDRQWQQTCGVTLAEVKSETRLLRWEGDNVEVIGYPHDRQAEVVAKRAGGKKGGNASWKKRKEAQLISKGSSSAPSSALKHSSNGRRRGRGIEGEAHVAKANALEPDSAGATPGDEPTPKRRKAESITRIEEEFPS